MCETSKKQMILRCPVCFARENDVVLHQKPDGTFYCVKCSFTGDTDTVHEMYADLKKKYRLVTKRLSLDEIEKL